MKKILIPQPVAREGVDFLEERGYEIMYADGSNEAEVREAIKDCSAVWLGVPEIGRKEMEAAPKLKIISRQGTGYNNVDVKAADELGIWVTNAPDATTNTVAEFILCGMIALSRKLVLCCEKLKEGEFFYKEDHLGEDLCGKTLSIIGYGRIGRLLAKKAYYGLNMKILAYGPHLTKEQTEDYVTAVDWETAFREGDFVSLHMPLNDKTRRSVGKKEFRMMKQTAKLINCARGAVVAENELIEALRSKEIAGLFTDVYEEEPVSSEHPFLKMENVLATPHMGSYSKECRVIMAMHAAEQIHKVLSGEQPDTPVNCPENSKNR
ncbi:hydroxyacid dehydrogenase [Clostridium sp. AM58-1XD]|uniref:hydroxyacid dehydrogenase n=1 Tax=Clostridium sp. AM58-1XD TaxID=2292307 RepID=UPI000E4AAE10|nr:hydroxyacid dehydrogenase [Clostridium sp. AM58-1XD]RGZ00477.1 phosphoglycerate dehydrogenase [Clostridium sp. AM58-1XD]